jgi:hypothetical protein
MNKEISPILGDIQKSVWQQELERLQRELNPESVRNAQIANRRRGAAQPGQGAGRNGLRGQQRLGMGPRRGAEIQTSPNRSNSLLNNVNENENIIEVLEPNNVNQ